MFSLLLFLFITIPLIEVYLLLNIGGAIGGLNTFLVVIVTGVLGAYFTKVEGRQVLFNIQKKLAQNGIPDKELVEGLLIFIGGVLLVTPGFLTDFLGLSFVFPLTRSIIAHYIRIKFESSMASGNSNFQFYYSSTDSSQSNRPKQNIDGDIVDAQYTTKSEKNLEE